MRGAPLCVSGVMGCCTPHGCAITDKEQMALARRHQLRRAPAVLVSVRCIQTGKTLLALNVVRIDTKVRGLLFTGRLFKSR